jgi:hypothetical protein
MANNGFKARLKRLNDKFNLIASFVRPVFFCDSLEEPKAIEYMRKNPKGIIFYGEKDLED